jgi:hypothetical protein
VSQSDTPSIRRSKREGAAERQGSGQRATFDQRVTSGGRAGTTQDSRVQRGIFITIRKFSSLTEANKKVFSVTEEDLECFLVPKAGLEPAQAYAH